jgi:hypothetical protein
MSPFSENKCKLLNPELGRRCRSIMSSRLAWATLWVQGQPELHTVTLSQKQTKKLHG